MRPVYGRKTGTIKITEHAHRRLLQRVRDFGEDKSWDRFVKNARYLGTRFYHLPKDFQKKYENRVRNYTNSTVSTYYKGYFFIFKGGHSRTLVTVFGDDEHTQKGEIK